MENVDLLMECGYTKPVPRVELVDKADIVQTITLHKVVLVSRGLSQFRKRLSALGVATALKDYPQLLRSFFCHVDQLTSGMDTYAYYT